MDDALLLQFQQAGDDLVRLGLAALGAGNLSVWTPEGVLITREGATLHRLGERDLSLIARSTKPPVANPSLDTPIHRAIYVTTGGKAIVHAHPPHAVALSFGVKQFRPEDLEGQHLLRGVPVISPRRSVIDLIAEASGASSVVLVEGHGTYARGRSLEEAVHLTAMLEESARIVWLRRLLPNSGATGLRQ